ARLVHVRDVHRGARRTRSGHHAIDATHELFLKRDAASGDAQFHAVRLRVAFSFDPRAVARSFPSAGFALLARRDSADRAGCGSNTASFASLSSGKAMPSRESDSIAASTSTIPASASTHSSHASPAVRFSARGMPPHALASSDNASAPNTLAGSPLAA